MFWSVLFWQARDSAGLLFGISGGRLGKTQEIHHPSLLGEDQDIHHSSLLGAPAGWLS